MVILMVFTLEDALGHVYVSFNETMGIVLKAYVK